MDPRKNFICKRCGLIINDISRQYGSETPCPRCEREDFINKHNEGDTSVDKGRR